MAESKYSNSATFAALQFERCVVVTPLRRRLSQISGCSLQRDRLVVEAPWVLGDRAHRCFGCMACERYYQCKGSKRYKAHRFLSIVWVEAILRKPHQEDEQGERQPYAVDLSRHPHFH
jgi:hypothetical protein